jgi:hypothetical protein
MSTRAAIKQSFQGTLPNGYGQNLKTATSRPELILRVGEEKFKTAIHINRLPVHSDTFKILSVC